MSKKNIIDNHIINIIQKESIREQTDLQTLLKKRGYDIPQATLSRRLKKLHIAKINGTYKIIDFETRSLPVVLNMQTSEYGIVVLHTHPGNANSLAAYIDDKYVTFNQTEKSTNILGTLAGDDTLLIIVKDQQSLKTVHTLLYDLFPYLKTEQ